MKVPSLAERCAIHAAKMDEEGWYTTANVLAHAAAELDPDQRPASRMTAAEFRAWRERMGFTQAEAAEALGLGRRVILYFESGERNVSGTVEKLCEALEKLSRRRR